jgi:hypothetical protein
MPKRHTRKYDKPTVSEYGAVESVTEDTDKIGDFDDGANRANLDGSIIPD